MKKWLILGLGQGIHKMSLEYFVVPESKDILRKKKPAMVEACHRDKLI